MTSRSSLAEKIAARAILDQRLVRPETYEEPGDTEEYGSAISVLPAPRRRAGHAHDPVAVVRTYRCKC